MLESSFDMLNRWTASGHCEIIIELGIEQSGSGKFRSNEATMGKPSSICIDRQPVKRPIASVAIVIALCALVGLSWPAPNFAGTGGTTASTYGSLHRLRGVTAASGAVFIALQIDSVS